jgi:hypothetical protein
MDGDMMLVDVWSDVHMRASLVLVLCACFIHFALCVRVALRYLFSQSAYPET